MNVRPIIAAAAILLAAPVLASCGFNEPTDRVYNASSGVDDRSGSVDVLSALIVCGVDGSGTVVAGLVNNDEQHSDRLTAISSGDSGAQSLSVSSPSGGTPIPAGGAVSLADQGQWQVTGKAVTPGQFVKLTFTFERGQAITVDVPVVLASNPMYSNVPLPK